ncbi:replication initiation protein [Pseudooceanicola sp. CBS1P-1]|uniref:Replication initiation protein n=1 Tax=Pseudooceanicola albus TaxID=2692189 RepID=A0A6L7G5G0_9RHOB|nr:MULTISPECIES: plasmid replication protein RepC [Pseudooceanicola]MBT9386812.1 replication initiation protein [Pseudooceanicola endophyticus]MXN19365.1 replication initiation protein [Pseudooceanicola albus]
MGYVPITPFRRTAEAVCVQRARVQSAPAPLPVVSKWDILSELTEARAAFGLSDRDISVLRALVSFHPGTDLGADPAKLVVFPSNASICTRLNGMPDSTMRRHLAALVASGLITRRDSPNGKRYMRRSRGTATAFGFDLSPLPRRFAEIAEAAEAQRSLQEEIAALRETLSLMRRDLLGLLESLPEECQDAALTLSEDTRRLLRRKAGLPELRQREAELSMALTHVPPAEVISTEEMSTNAAEYEQHYQSLKKESSDSEDDPSWYPMQSDIPGSENALAKKKAEAIPPRIALRTVMSACPSLNDYAEGPIRSWSDLVRTAEGLRPMMGICRASWEETKRHMGQIEAAIVMAAMLERFEEIKSPGAYMRGLSQKAARNGFSAMPMVLALLRREGTAQYSPGRAA